MVCKMNNTQQPGRRWMRSFLTIWTGQASSLLGSNLTQFALVWWLTSTTGSATVRSEEHTSELQSRQYIVCSLLLEKKKKRRTEEKTMIKEWKAGKRGTKKEEREEWKRIQLNYKK